MPNDEISAQPAQESDPDLHLTVGRERLVISNRYETLSIANDVLIGIFFFVGSVMFYFKALEVAAVTMFVLGSIDFLLRPTIRVARRLHLQRLGRRDDRGSQYY